MAMTFVSLVLLAAIVYVPFFQAPFGTFALSRTDWVCTAVLAFTAVPVLEGVHWIERQGFVGELR